MNDYLPRKDADLENWVANFLTVAAANLSTLGLTTPDLDPIAGDSTVFSVGLTNIVTTKAAAKAAVAGKNATHKTLVSDVRVLVKRIQAKTGVSASLKAELGINDNSGGRTTTPPITVKDVMANGNSLGVNSIVWNKNGNIPTTQFVVEAKKPTDTTWNIVGQTTRSKFDHTGQTPGVALSYRVVAARADKASVPSAVATVYNS